MSRIACTVVAITLLIVLVGCHSADSGISQLVPDRSRIYGSDAEIEIRDAGETDIVEQIAINRQTYRQGLESLVRYYTKIGNNMKFKWAKRELEALDAIPQYKYITEAEFAGPNLRATTAIPEADDLYDDAIQLEKEAGALVLVKDDELLRLALDRYDRLIKKYPSSDKIDDAAFNAGVIYEHFKDYSIALLSYQRAYEWDPAGTNPARFRAARILDKRLHRYSDALELYRQAVKTEGKYEKNRRWKEFAEQRILALYRSESATED